MELSKKVLCPTLGAELAFDKWLSGFKQWKIKTIIQLNVSRCPEVNWCGQI